VIGFLDTGSSKRGAELMPAFFRGLAENSFVEGRDVAVDPVALDIVASLNHPGDNLTGIPMRDIGGPNRVMANMEYRRCADWPQSP
jgi:hypothetical protein